MIANVLFATTIQFIALLFFLVQECALLIPCLPVSTSPRASCF